MVTEGSSFNILNTNSTGNGGYYVNFFGFPSSSEIEWFYYKEPASMD
jgi:hypothetical protein